MLQAFGLTHVLVFGGRSEGDLSKQPGRSAPMIHAGACVGQYIIRHHCQSERTGKSSGSSADFTRSRLAGCAHGMRLFIRFLGYDWVGIGGLGQEAVDPIALVLEVGEQVPVDFAGTGQLDPHRVDEMAIHQNFVMEMRARRETALAEIADDLALPDALTFLDAAGEGRKMVVGRLIAIGMLDFDPAAIA